MNLKEAYDALSNIQNINVRQPDYNMPINIEGLSDVQVAGAYNLTPDQTLESGNAAYTILNQVPLTYMINGGNNNQVAAFVYAQPNAEGSNDILMVVMSGYRGMVMTLYCKADDAIKTQLQQAPLEMSANYLNITTNLSNDSEFSINVGKGR